MEEFTHRDNCPRFVTVETNGTQALSDDFKEMLNAFNTSSEYGGMVQDDRGTPEWFWSVSPKLFNTSGEKRKKAIKPGKVIVF